MRRGKGVIGCAAAAGAVLSFAAPAVAADQIAYSCRGDICTIDPDAGGPTNLTQSTGSSELWPSWSPDGTQIALQSDATSSGSYDVFTIRATDTPPVEGLNVSQSDDYNDNSEAPAWSPDGTRLAFTADPIGGSGDGNDVLIGSPDGTAELVDVNPGGAAHHPTWSPDGTKLAFSSVGGVYTVTPAALGPPAPVPGSIGIYPEWSPDGTRIAMLRDDPASLYSLIRVVRADGSGQFVDLPVTASNQDVPAWSPDSSKVAYVDSNNAIRVAPADGSGPGITVPVPAGTVVVHNLSFSPDGTRLAFDAYTPPVSFRDVLVAPADGSGEARAITTNPGEDQYPVWKPGPGGPPVQPPPPARPPKKVQFSKFKRLNIRNHHMLLVSVNCGAGPTPAAIAAGCNYDGTATAKGWQRAGAKRAKVVKFAKSKMHLDDGEKAPFPLKLTKAGRKLLKPGAKMTITTKVTLTRPDIKKSTQKKTIKYKVPRKGA